MSRHVLKLTRDSLNWEGAPRGYPLHGLYEQNATDK